MEVLGIKKNFLAIEERFSSYENSSIVILPIPYEETTSYGKGTRFAPKEILRASAFVEFYDDETEKELCFDKGIATLKQLSFKKLTTQQAFDLIEEYVVRILEDDKFLVCLGGEHTITLPIVRRFYRKFPRLSVLQFDAHSDLRLSYENNPYSHACVMARIVEFLPPERVVQVGIRALSVEEANWIEESPIHTYFASKIKAGKYGKNWCKELVGNLTEEVYITFDVDFFDPSVMPSTGTPEPDGFSYNDALNVIREVVASGRKIVGFDVVELAPIKDFHHPNLTTARLVYKILNLAFYNSKR
ncbi:MAG: agmatinase [Candidatus Kapaibacteriota bacterium]